MALDTSRRNGRGGMLLTRRSSYGGGGTASAARHDEAARWLADHTAELAEPDITGGAHDEDWSRAYINDLVPTLDDGTYSEAVDEYDDLDDGRLHQWALDDAADRAREAIEDRLTDPDLPGWGTTFDPADVQWGFTTHRSPHTLPGAVSGRPQPAHLAR